MAQNTAATPHAALASVKKSARWKPRIIEKCFGGLAAERSIVAIPLLAESKLLTHHVSLLTTIYDRRERPRFQLALRHPERSGKQLLRILALVFQCDACLAPCKRCSGEPVEATCRFGVAQSLGPDIGEAVAFGIGASDTRIESEIDAQAIGRRQPRPLADKHGDQPRAKTLAYLIAQRDPSLQRDDCRGARPSLWGMLQQRTQQRRRMPLHRDGGESILDREGYWNRASGKRAFLGEFSTEIRSAQISRAVRRGAPYDAHLESKRTQFDSERLGVERCMNGIACASVSQTETQHFVGRQCTAGAAERDTRRGVGA